MAGPMIRSHGMEVAIVVIKEGYHGHFLMNLYDLIGIVCRIRQGIAVLLQKPAPRAYIF